MYDCRSGLCVNKLQTHSDCIYDYRAIASAPAMWLSCGWGRHLQNKLLKKMMVVRRSRSVVFVGGQRLRRRWRSAIGDRVFAFMTVRSNFGTAA